MVNTSSQARGSLNHSLMRSHQALRASCSWLTKPASRMGSAVLPSTQSAVRLITCILALEILKLAATEYSSPSAPTGLPNGPSTTPLTTVQKPSLRRTTSSVPHFASQDNVHTSSSSIALHLTNLEPCSRSRSSTNEFWSQICLIKLISACTKSRKIRFIVSAFSRFRKISV